MHRTVILVSHACASPFALSVAEAYIHLCRAAAVHCSARVHPCGCVPFHLQVRMLDSLGKRCDFVQGAVASLGINNAKTVWGRAETLGQDAGHREVYDIAIARAVADMRVLSELCLPFVRTGGRFVAAKGPEPSVEVAAACNALQVLGGRLVCVEEVESLSEDGRPRTAVVVNKDVSTPPKYPRREGLPSKRPLRNL